MTTIAERRRQLLAMVRDMISDPSRPTWMQVFSRLRDELLREGVAGLGGSIEFAEIRELLLAYELDTLRGMDARPLGELVNSRMRMLDEIAQSADVTKVITVRMPKSTYLVLRRQAHAADVSMNQFVLDLLAAASARCEPCSDGRAAG